MKTDIEYAALVMGKPLYYSNNVGGYSFAEPYSKADKFSWNPLHDDGDSRRLENACFRWMAEHEGKYDELPKRVVSERSHLAGVRDYGTDEAVRAAVFALAGAIGKTISAGDAIDGGGV
jgi:hypothetical protein